MAALDEYLYGTFGLGGESENPRRVRRDDAYNPSATPAYNQSVQSDLDFRMPRPDIRVTGRGGTPGNGGVNPNSGTGTPSNYQFNLTDFEKAFRDAIRGREHTGTLQYYQDVIFPQLQKMFPDIKAYGSKGDKILLPNGQVVDAVYAAGLGGRGYYFGLQTPGQGGGGGGVSEFDDPWGAAFERYLNQYFGELGKEPNRSFLDEYLGRLHDADAAKQANVDRFVDTLHGRIDELNKPAYTDAEDAAIRAKAFDQLSRRHQETLKNRREELYARGFAPTSGLVAGAEDEVNRNFEQARTGIESDLTRSAIDETQRRRDQAVQLSQLAEAALSGADLQSLQFLASGMGAQEGVIQDRNDRLNQMLQAYLLPLNLEAQRQQLANQTLNSGQDPMTAILQLLALARAGASDERNADANNQEGLGALLDLILGHL